MGSIEVGAGAAATATVVASGGYLGVGTRCIGLTGVLPAEDDEPDLASVALVVLVLKAFNLQVTNYSTPRSTCSLETFTAICGSCSLCLPTCFQTVEQPTDE